MCTICNAAMDAVADRGDGATAHAWDRVDAAIRAWREAQSDDVQFEGVLDECQAWCEHMLPQPPEKGER